MKTASRSKTLGSAPPSGLPTFQLYGDAAGERAVDWLHHESIAERSRLHNWEIRPHRHDELLQFLYIATGQASLVLDHHRLQLRGPAMVWVPPSVVHGFQFSPDVDGDVLTLQHRHIDALLGRDPALRTRLQSACLAPVEADSALQRQVSQCMAQLRAEFALADRWRQAALDGLLLQLCALLARQNDSLHDGTHDGAHDSAHGGPQPEAAASRPARHLQRYRAMIDARLREQPSMDAVAADLGLSVTQLNRICRRLTGRSALALWHERLVLEAQRELTYTLLSIKQIGLGLGFQDAAYFTRFFQRLCGMSPSLWRSQAASPGR